MKYQAPLPYLLSQSLCSNKTQHCIRENGGVGTLHSAVDTKEKKKNWQDQIGKESQVYSI